MSSGKSCSNQFQSQLKEILSLSSSDISDHLILAQIKKVKQYTENKVYHLFTSDKAVYFQSIWEYLVANDPIIEDEVQVPLNSRMDIVYQDIMEDKIKLLERLPLLPYDYEDQYKHHRLSVLKHQSSRLKKKINDINENMGGFHTEREQSKMKNIYDSLYSEEKKKKIEEFVRQKRKEQNERKRKSWEMKTKQEEERIRAEKERKEQEERRRKIKLEQMVKEEKEKEEKRKKEKNIREQRNTEYIRLKHSMKEKPPLFKKIQNSYSKRYNQSEKQKHQRIQNQRKYLNEHIQKQQIEQHQRKYSEIKFMKEKERKERILLLSQEEKSRIKYHSSFQLPPKSPDQQFILKQQAKAKWLKMNDYKLVVKEKFQPKVDEEKRKELLNMIEEMELNKKHVKRTKLENGSVVYEELREVDPKILGMEYLQRVKEMAQKQKGKKKVEKETEEKQVRKMKNYLQDLKNQRLKKGNTEQKKGDFMNRKNLSYDDKLKKVILESDKLTEQTRQTEMKLKYGKFKTSEEILACKEEIDQNYIDIVNMKLKLIENQSPS